MSQEKTPFTQADYQQVIEYLTAMNVCLDFIAPAAATPDRDSGFAKAMVKGLALGVQQHCVLGGYALDYQQLARQLENFRPQDPQDALEALPIAHSIEMIFAARNSCDCMNNLCGGLVHLCEIIHRHAVDPRAN